MKWKVASASVRGSSHQRNGLPNQDAALSLVSKRQQQGMLAIAAVSDGHGSPRHFRSQIGSSHAVNIAASLVEEFLLQRADTVTNEAPDPAEIHELQKGLVEAWLASVSADLHSNPFTEEEILKLVDSEGIDGRNAVESEPTLAYGATLLVAGTTGASALCLQLGDGDILHVAAGGHTTRPLPEDARLVANQTTSLCLPDAWKDFRSAWSSGSELPALILLSTDGYLNSFRSEEDFLKVGTDYLSLVREQGIDSLSHDLPKILAEASEQGSGDDISLAMLQGDVTLTGGEDGKKLHGAALPSLTKSAMIKELKEQHSNQQRMLGDLSKQVEQTQRDNQRLRRTMITLASILVVAVAAFFFRNFLFPRPQAVMQPEKLPSVKGINPASSDPGENPAAAAKQSGTWVLHLNNDKNISLLRGTKISKQQLTQTGGKTPYAEVDYENSSLEIINLSGDSWKVTTSSAKKPAIIAKWDHVVLAGDTHIVFDNKVSGVLQEKAHPKNVTPDLY